MTAIDDGNTTRDRRGTWRRQSDRRGYALVAALACLVVVTMVMAAAVRRFTLGRNKDRLNAKQVQAMWLAESGVNRARVQVQANPQYRGETWEIAADRLPPSIDFAEVVIRLAPSESDATSQVLLIEAHLGRDPIQRIVYPIEQVIPATSAGANL